MKKVTVGFIGLGEHGIRAHAMHMRVISKVEVVVGCDPSEEARAAFSKRFPNATLVATEDELYSSCPNLDAVFVMSPDRFHTASAYKAIEAGKHVFVEKPLADSLEQLTQLQAALAMAKQKGLVFSSCHPRRFDPPYMWLKSMMGNFNSIMGRVLDVQLDFSYHQPTKTGLHKSLLLDHVSHEIDTLHYLFGIEAFSARRIVEEETRYQVVGQRNDGITFLFNGTRMLDDIIYPEYVTIRFEAGSLMLNTLHGIAWITPHQEGIEPYSEEAKSTDYLTRFVSVNRNFIDAIRGDAESYLTRGDLECNTAIGIMLHEEGVFESMRTFV